MTLRQPGCASGAFSFRPLRVRGPGGQARGRCQAPSAPTHFQAPRVGWAPLARWRGVTRPAGVREGVYSNPEVVKRMRTLTPQEIDATKLVARSFDSTTVIANREVCEYGVAGLPKGFPECCVCSQKTFNFNKPWRFEVAGHPQYQPEQFGSEDEALEGLKKYLLTVNWSSPY